MDVALFGLNHPHSLLHLDSFHAIDEIDSVFVWKDNGTDFKQIEYDKYYKVKIISNNIDDIKKANPLFGITSLRHDRIKDICINLIDSKINILAEKPLGINFNEAKYIYDYSLSKDHKLGICYINRAEPRVQKTKDLLKEGHCGKLHTIEMRMITTAVDHRLPSHWLFKKKYSGGGILIWLGCHYIDLIRYIFDDEIVSVFAEMGKLSKNDIDVEDTCSLILRFKHGQIATLNLAYLLTMSGSGYNNKSGYDTYVSFNGSQGRIIWSANEQPMSLYVESCSQNWKYKQKNINFQLEPSQAYGGSSGESFLRNFINWCLNKEVPLATGFDAVKTAQIIDAAYQSSVNGKKININPYDAK